MGRQTPIPTGFRFSGGSKEMHGHPIYCVSWSTDYHYRIDDDEEEEEDNMAKSPAKHDNNGNEETKTTSSSSSKEKNDTNISSCTSTKSTNNTTKKLEEVEKSKVIRYIATCGGGIVTIYEVDCSSSSVVQAKAAAASSAGNNNNNDDSIKVRQVYEDVDDVEMFYTCAFGGIGVSREQLLDLDDGGGSERNDDNSNGEVSTTQLNADSLISRSNTDSSTIPVGSPHKRQRNTNTRTPTQRYYQNLSTLSRNTGPQLLCVGGTRGVIKVIDTTRRALILTLAGHGDEIYDLKVSPSSPWLILTASKDESLRLWNLQSGVCVAIFAGHYGHRDSVLSIGFHPFGNRFVSGGMDTTVKLWTLDHEDIALAITESFAYGKTTNNTSHEENKQHLVEEDAADGSIDNRPTKPRPTKPFKTRYEQMPYFSTKKVHTDYVDCVQFVGDLVLSKSISNTIALWKPYLLPQTTGTSHHHNKLGPQPSIRLCDKVIPLREFKLNNCDIWFVRFATDLPNCNMLAVGNNVGEIKVWEIGPNSINKKSFCNLTLSSGGNNNGAGNASNFCKSTSTVRMVAFSPDGRSLVATCDDSTVWKWDAV
mmetsp:Transcript_24206/g.35383  ORF Transcript_24206/g.35383 Transcript_24206/m.35383 type:complete len:592 (-) Transcript_24206:50-1825(-)